MLTKKNRAAIDQWGARKILGYLANISPKPPESEEQGREFVQRCGELYDSLTPEFDAIGYAKTFLWAWDAKDGRNVEAVNGVNRMLDDIFARDLLSNNPEERPGIAADFMAQQWEPKVRNLLDVLARELMRSRKMLHRCERPECQRYMVKEFSRDRYCSRTCAEIMRAKGQSDWAKDHKEEIKCRRRKRSTK